MNGGKENPRCGNSADEEKIEESMVISINGETVAQAVLSTIRGNPEA